MMEIVGWLKCHLMLQFFFFFLLKVEIKKKFKIGTNAELVSRLVIRVNG